ncbi:hypothetical protein [Rathayibacter tanaceti]|uniref:DoxX-like protein n=2 Tax=Rathayibacter tanaceti TaxID=1671680 RepID=A0A162GHB3_9MICO|nr:hypothetical protein [Rathayibacter tanaceti]KZX21139.1 hypothetical protein ACH61_01720 [Rathayibacter tanaceti]QHC56193.1 hypothetical protein GSU10_11490 [Rathayibacter tanaceti]TCO37039.1 hypothetical protein EV639_105125 [Rathayibacter tanaceti]
MKNIRAFRIAARVWAGAGLIVVAVLYLLAAGSVDSAAGAQFAAGMTVAQGAVLRVLAVLDIIAGAWVLIRPRSYPGLTAAAVAVIALWLAPRLGAPALVDLGSFALDVRFVTHPIEVSVVVAGLAVTAFWMTRNLSARARARRGS